MTEDNNIPDHFYRISIKALILDEQKRFLLALEDKGLWEFPGGGLGYDEEPSDCIRREIGEEMNIEVTFVSDRPSYFVKSLSHNGRWNIANIIYETKLKDLNFKPSDECIDLRYFTREEALKEKLFPNVLEFVKIYNPDNH